MAAPPSKAPTKMKLSFSHGTTTNDECVFFCRNKDNDRVVLRVKRVWFESVVIVTVPVDTTGSHFVDYEKFPKWQGDKEHQDGERMVNWYPVTKSHPMHEALKDALRRNDVRPSHCFTQFTAYTLAMLEDPSYSPYQERSEGEPVAQLPAHNVLCVYIKERNRLALNRRQAEIKSLMREHGADTVVGDKKVTYYAKMLEKHDLNVISTIEVSDFEMMYRGNRISTNLHCTEITVEDFSSIRVLHEGWMEESPLYNYVGRDKKGKPKDLTTRLQMPICWFDFEQSGMYVTNISELNSIYDHVMMCSFGMFGKPSTVVIMGEVHETPEGIDRVITVPYGDKYGFWVAIRDTFIYYDADLYMAWNGNGYDFPTSVIYMTSCIIPGYEEQRVRGLFTADFLMMEAGKQLVGEVFAPLSVLSVPEESANIQKLYGKTSSFLQNPFTLHVSGRQFVDAMIADMVVEPYKPSYSLKETALRRGVTEKEGPSYVELGRAFMSMWYWKEISLCDHSNKVCCGGGTLHIDETGTYRTECDCTSSDLVPAPPSEDAPEALEIEAYEPLDEEVEVEDGAEQDILAGGPILEDKVTKVSKIRTLRVPCTKACPYCMFRANKAAMDITFSQMSKIQVYSIFCMRVKDHDLYDFETALSFWNRAVLYVMNDTRVMMEIALSVSMSQGLIAMCNTNRTFISKIVAGQTARFVNLFYWESVREGFHYIDNQLKKNNKMYGGQVTPPIIGIFQSVPDLDANSLYPSEMIQHNLDPSTNVHPWILEAFVDRFPTITEGTQYASKQAPGSFIAKTFNFTVVDDFPSTKAEAPADTPAFIMQAGTRKVGGIMFNGPDGYLDVRLAPELRITTNVRYIKAFNFQRVEPRFNKEEIVARAKENPKDPIVVAALEDALVHAEEVVATYTSDDACTTNAQEFNDNLFRNNTPDCTDFKSRLIKTAEKVVLKEHRKEWIKEIRADNQKRQGKTIHGESKKVRWYLYAGMHPDIYKYQPKNATLIVVYKVIYSQVPFSVDEPIDMTTWSAYMIPTTNFEPHSISFRSYTYISNLPGKAPVIEKRLLDARARVRKVDMASEAAKNDPQLMTDLDAKQKALKETANSMYGARGTNGEHFSRSDQETITGMGRFFIQEAIMLQTSFGFICIYSDTDSDITLCVIIIPTELIGILGDLLQKKVNKYLASKYHALRVGSDGFFKMLVTTNPKKYVMYTEDGEIEFKGLMIKKRDQIKWAQNTAKRAYEMRILGSTDEEVIAFVEQQKELIDQTTITEVGISGPVPIEHMCKRVFLTDETKSTPQVQVAEKLGAAGFKVARGDMIDFFRMRNGFYGSPLIPDNVRNIDLEWVKDTVRADILGLKRAMKYVDPVEP